MAVKIIPTVLARTKEEFDQRLQKLLPVADELQVDFEDGRFVPSTGVPVHEVPDLRNHPEVSFEAHLMVQTPGALIQPVAQRGFKRVIFHVEVIDERIMAGLLEQCVKYGVRPVLAINPETPVDVLLPYAHQVDGVLFLGVHPGFNGAPYVPETAGRIAEFAMKNPNKALSIQVDGGMTPETIAGVAAAGATRINSGSFISNAPDPKAAIRQLIDAAEAVTPTVMPAAQTPSTQIPSAQARSQRPVGITEKSLCKQTKRANNTSRTNSAIRKPVARKTTSRTAASRETTSRTTRRKTTLSRKTNSAGRRSAGSRSKRNAVTERSKAATKRSKTTTKKSATKKSAVRKSAARKSAVRNAAARNASRRPAHPRSRSARPARRGGRNASGKAKRAGR
jgi:ribulose-phosphate 3-epimerase